uniref:Uncharacterized protein n=1 Tax=Trichinella nativa TaxID=6335 RepID=A0A0V1KIS4_9BILA
MRHLRAKLSSSGNEISEEYRRLSISQCDKSPC